MVIEAVRTLPRLSDACERVLHGVAWLAWVSAERARRHKNVPHAFWVHHEELGTLFGRGRFSALNVQYTILQIVGQARPRETRAYRLASDIDDLVTAALRTANHAADLSVMVVPDGWLLAKPPPAIERESLTDSSIWRATHIGLPVPVPRLDLLAALDDWLARAASAGRGARECQLRAVQIEPHTDLHYLRRYLERFRWRLHTELPGRGYYESKYRQTDAGRLQEVDFGLQGAPRIIKRCALHGFHAYDISACHISILGNIAPIAGIKAEAAVDYSDHKDERRDQVHQRTRVPLEIVKQGFTAMGYGSKQWDGWDEDDDCDSITMELVRRHGEQKGRELAAAFWGDEYVRYFQSDFERVGREVEKALRRGRGLWLRNAAGCVYNGHDRKARGKKDTWSTRLAFILQGEEARALHAVVTAFPDQMLVLEHDGWTARNEMSVPAVQRAIEKALNFPLRVEGKMISAPSILLHRTITALNVKAA
jgi:hypothetical protein